MSDRETLWFTAGLLAFIGGCGIPPLRCPKPMPPTPANYQRPVEWDQPSQIDDLSKEKTVKKANAEDLDSTAEATVDPPQGQVIERTSASSTQQENDDAVTFANFIQAASTATLNGPTNSQNDNDVHVVQKPLVEHTPAQLTPALLTVAKQDTGGPVSNDQKSQKDLLEEIAGSATHRKANSNAQDGLTTVDGMIEVDTGMIGPNGLTVESTLGFNTMGTSAQMSRYEFFKDPNLTSLIDQALVGNQELRILAQEVRIACLESYARSGEYRPFVTLGGRASVDKPGLHTRNGAVEDQLQVAPGSAFPEPLPDFLVAADVSWELDIWRRLRNAQGAAALRYLATNDGRNYVITRLVAEISENYYQLLAYDNQLTTLQLTIDLQKRSLQAASAMKLAGRGTELAVNRFEGEVRKNQSERMIIQQNIIETENRINYLVGRYPQPISRPDVDYIDLNLAPLNAGLPSELLLNRSDIREAERRIAAAGLDVQSARARFYPSLSLNAGLGWNAFSTGYLFQTPESLIYGVAGELVGPLINKRAIKAQYLTANALQLQAIYDYQQTILEAHMEVVNYMTKAENYRQSIEVKRLQLTALEASVSNATQLFQNARAEYVEVLLAQREFMEAKMEIIRTKQEQLGAVVNAYQALGGGGGGTTPLPVVNQ